MGEFNQKEYIKQYKKDHYDSLNLKIKKGKKEIYKAFAEEQGLSMVQLVTEAIEEKMERANKK